MRNNHKNFQRFYNFSAIWFHLKKCSIDCAWCAPFIICDMYHHGVNLEICWLRLFMHDKIQTKIFLFEKPILWTFLLGLLPRVEIFYASTVFFVPSHSFIFKSSSLSFKFLYNLNFHDLMRTYFRVN